MAQAISGTSAKRHAIRASMVWAVLIIVRVLDPMLKAVTQSLVDASASPVSVVLAVNLDVPVGIMVNLAQRGVTARTMGPAIIRTENASASEGGMVPIATLLVGLANMVLTATRTAHLVCMEMVHVMHRKGLVFVQQDGGEQDVIGHVLLDTGDLAVVENADVVMVQSVTQKQESVTVFLVGEVLTAHNLALLGPLATTAFKHVIVETMLLAEAMMASVSASQDGWDQGVHRLAQKVIMEDSA